jgi:hypothetical protein
VSIARLLEAGAGTAPVDAARILEERVQEFVARAKPAIAAPALTGRGHELRRWVVSLSACSYYARLLAQTADRSRGPVEPPAAAQLTLLDDLIAANIHAASERIGGRHDAKTSNTLPLFDALRAQANAHGSDEALLLSATRLLERLDRTVARLARDEGTVTEIA